MLSISVYCPPDTTDAKGSAGLDVPPVAECRIPNRWAYTLKPGILRSQRLWINLATATVAG